MDKILKLLKKNARMSVEDMALATSMSIEEVTQTIKKLEQEKVILGYYPVLNLNVIDEPNVTALVEIKFSLNDKIGFQELSNTIANMDEVDSVHLVSGGYDLCIVMRGKDIQEIAFFVNEKLSSMECVLSTNTHFVLKTFKEHGYHTADRKTDKREVML
ncbi:MAG: Lrp/AsnC family transcriptional regulator [Clostridia bacterium]